MWRLSIFSTTGTLDGPCIIGKYPYPYISRTVTHAMIPSISWRASPPFQKLRMQLPIYISDIISNNILRRYRLRLMVYATQFRFRLDIGPAFCVGSDQCFGLSDSG